ncbi:hypothetical protein BC629DRAFT_1725797 [Irpex lacteus]|nr:hypothetical protein BC629DRAFT_1725797 [Irpex lacteus]
MGDVGTDSDRFMIRKSAGPLARRSWVMHEHLVRMPAQKLSDTVGLRDGNENEMKTGTASYLSSSSQSFSDGTLSDKARRKSILENACKQGTPLDLSVISCCVLLSAGNPGFGCISIWLDVLTPFEVAACRFRKLMRPRRRNDTVKGECSFRAPSALLLATEPRSVVTTSQGFVKDAPVISSATSISLGSTRPNLSRYSDSSIRTATCASREDRTSPNVLSERSYRRLPVVGMNDRKGWVTAGRGVSQLQVHGIRQRNNPEDLTVTVWRAWRRGRARECPERHEERGDKCQTPDQQRLLDLGLPQELEITRRREEDQAFIQVLRPKPTLNDDFDGTDCCPHRHPYRRSSTGLGRVDKLGRRYAAVHTSIQVHLRHITHIYQT